jgi:hypothetical protein
MRTLFTNRHLSRLVWAVLAVLLLAGCSDDDPTTPDPGAYPFADTEDRALVNFKTAYESLDTDAYVDVVLDDEYGFVFADNSPYTPAAGWDRGAEVESVTSMFAGNAGYDTVLDTAKPGVQDIDFRTLRRLNAWEDVPLSDPEFPGARKALFEVEIVFILDGGTNTYTMAGQQLFYVMGAEETVGGVARTRWRVCGQKDLTASSKAGEPMSWGTLKTIYHPDPASLAYPLPDTEDKIMINFRNAYSAMHTDVYIDGVLFDEYRFVFVDGSPYAPAGGWDRSTEVESVTSMFAGTTGYNPVHQMPEPGVQDVDFRRLLRLSAWEDVPLNDPDFPGARRALFEVELVFYLDTGVNTFTVAGQQLFYVKSTPVVVNGATRTRWGVCGQKDLTASGKGNENTTWGQVKSFY